jgi:hypothetical protein
MWNSNEWINFSQAAPGAQRPMLLDALLGLKSGRTLQAPLLVKLNRLVLGYIRQFESFLSMPPVMMQWRDNQNCGRMLTNFNLEAGNYAQQIQASDIQNAIGIEVKQNLIQSLTNAGTICQVVAQNKAYQQQPNPAYNPFIEPELTSAIQSLNNVLILLPEEVNDYGKVTPDTPIQFNIQDLPAIINQIADNEGNNFAQFVAMLNLRLRFLIEDERLRSVVNPDDSITLVEWLKQYIGDENAENGQIAVIDLSLLPSDIVHTIVAVMSRLVFEAIQRYRRINGNELPTVIVLEEAHTFIRNNTNQEVRSSQLCVEVFERIAREGRKFGLSMVLSSQRPSELSPTVLSQCNTFLLHRLVNDKDQELVKRLVPDNIGGLLKELPILPTRKAILLGWASPIPMLIELRELEEEHRPHSNDPEFWSVWTGESPRSINWEPVVKDWQGTLSEDSLTLKQEEGRVVEEHPDVIPPSNEIDEDDLPF